MRLFSGDAGCATSNKRLDVGADPDRDADRGNFKGIFTVAR